jgi:DNA polymerase delta subunit 2
MGTSGQNIKNLIKYQSVENPLQLAETTLLWRHMAPTAPDHLPCFPFYEEDPFILETCPHIYFIGNQSKFDTKVIHGNAKNGAYITFKLGAEGQNVRIVMVPSFVDTNTVVLVNLRTLNVHPITFNV